MASSYFDEHDVSSGETPDQMVLMARLLIDTGMWNQVHNLCGFRWFWMTLHPFTTASLGENVQYDLWKICGRFRITSTRSFRLLFY